LIDFDYDSRAFLRFLHSFISMRYIHYTADIDDDWLMEVACIDAFIRCFHYILIEQVFWCWYHFLILWCFYYCFAFAISHISSYFFILAFAFDAEAFLPFAMPRRHHFSNFHRDAIIVYTKNDLISIILFHYFEFRPVKPGLRTSCTLWLGLHASFTSIFSIFSLPQRFRPHASKNALTVLSVYAFYHASLASRNFDYFDYQRD